MEALSVAYLVSQYPAPSHVFIEREIAALRRQGVRVETFSVRPTPTELLLSDAMRTEARGTRVLLASRPALLLAVLRLLVRHPDASARALGRALRTGDRTLRARLWQVFYLVEAVRLRELMRRRGLRHLHVHFANNGADIARALVALGEDVDGTGSGWQWTLTMHGPTEFENVDRLDLPAKVLSASGIACISDFTRSQLMRLCSPREWPKLRVVPMSVDVDRFRPPAAARKHGGPFRVLFVGRLVPEKGPSILVEALHQLALDDIPVEARIVGSGPLAETLAAEVAARGLGDSVDLVGALGQDSLLAEYHWADVFCLPSFQEGLPVVLMEAMATELPVVATPVAGIPELVKDGVTGLTVNPGRPDLVAEALAGLGRSPEQRLQLGQRGRRAVRRQHALEVAGPSQERFLRDSRQADLIGSSKR